MKKYLLLLLIAAMFYSCNMINGSGHIITEKRDVAKFNGVQVSGSMDMEISQGDEFSVDIKADDNALPYIVTEVNDGLLDVHYKSNVSFDNVNVKVYITAPKLGRLFIKGSGNIVTKNTLKTDEIETDISGSGDINADIDAPEVKAGISGSGNLTLSGHCKNFDGTISGSGDLKCKRLLSENTSVNIFGSGTAHVYASVQLKATTAGSGDIYYSGNPPAPEITKSGSGTVEAEK